MHVSTRQVLRYFQYSHLKDGPGKHVAELYAHLAVRMAEGLPEDPETAIALRKLLESKDAAVRAALEIHVFEEGKLYDEKDV